MDKAIPKKEEMAEEREQEAARDKEDKVKAAWYANQMPDQRRRRERQSKQYHDKTREQKEVINKNSKARYNRMVSSHESHDVGRGDRRREQMRQYSAKRRRTMTEEEREKCNERSAASKERKTRCNAMIEKGVRKGVFLGYRRVADGSFAACVNLWTKQPSEAEATMHWQDEAARQREMD